MTKRITIQLAATLLIIVGLSACATRPPATDLLAVEEYERANDPFEPANRVMFKLNMLGDRLILRPMVKGYLAVVPEPARNGVSNFLANLWEPWTAVNELLQGKPKDAGKSLGRFVINSTIGIAGVMNPAEDMGLVRTQEDFGQTLGVWGIGEGPYIILPFFGPSNPRDTLGLAGDFYGDPTGLMIDSANVGKDFFLGIDLLSYIHFGADAFDARARHDEAVEELYKATDPYSVARSAYRQLRRFEISDGAIEEDAEEEDLFDEDFDDEIVD